MTFPYESLEHANVAVAMRRDRMARDRRALALTVCSVVAVFAFIGALVLGWHP